MPDRPPPSLRPLPLFSLAGCLLLTVLTLAVPAGAGEVIYRYVDDNGAVSFANHRDAIPLKYQASAQALDAVTFQPVQEPAAGSAPAPAEPEFETPAGLSKLQKTSPDGQAAQPAPVPRAAAQPQPIAAEPATPGWLDQLAGTRIPLPSQFQLGVGLTTLALIVGAVMVSRVSRNPLLKLLLRSSIMLLLGGSVYLMYFSGMSEKIAGITHEPGQQTTSGKELLDQMKAKTGEALTNNPVAGVIEKTKAATIGEANQAVNAANRANQQLDRSLKEIDSSQ